MLIPFTALRHIGEPPPDERPVLLNPSMITSVDRYNSDANGVVVSVLGHHTTFLIAGTVEEFAEALRKAEAGEK